VTFTATVSPQSRSGGPTWTVTFEDRQATLETAPLDASGTSSLAVGTHQITAMYGGDSLDPGSSSQPLTQVVITDTPQNLASLTLQYVEGSAKFQALPPSQQQLIEQLAGQVFGQLAKITPRLSASQLPTLVAAYKHGVAVLQSQGRLTAAQASTFDGLADHVHP
jgi:hypothetical protein